MNRRLRLVVAGSVVAGIVPLVVGAVGHGVSAACDTGSTASLYHPLTGQLLVASSDGVLTPSGTYTGNCIATPLGSPFVGAAVGGPGLTSIGQACYMPVTGNCLFNYSVGAYPTGSLNTNPVTTTNTGPACVGTSCPGVKVDTGLDVTVYTGNSSNAVVELPTVSRTEPVCASVGAGTC